MRWSSYQSVADTLVQLSSCLGTRHKQRPVRLNFHGKVSDDMQHKGSSPLVVIIATSVLEAVETMKEVAADEKLQGDSPVLALPSPPARGIAGAPDTATLSWHSNLPAPCMDKEVECNCGSAYELIQVQLVDVTQESDDDEDEEQLASITSVLMVDLAACSN